MVTVAIVGAAAPSRDGLGLVHLWLVRIIVDIVLTLRSRTRLKNHTNEGRDGPSVALKAKGVLVSAFLDKQNKGGSKRSAGILPSDGG